MAFHENGQYLYMHRKEKNHFKLTNRSVVYLSLCVLAVTNHNLGFDMR